MCVFMASFMLNRFLLNRSFSLQHRSTASSMVNGKIAPVVIFSHSDLLGLAFLLA